MAFDTEDVPGLLEDFGIPVRATDQCETLGILTEGEVFVPDGQGTVKVGDATIKIATGSLALTKQMFIECQEDEDSPTRRFRVRDWRKVGGGSLTDLIVVEEPA